MTSVVWQIAFRSCADPPRARHYFEKLQNTSAGPILRNTSAEQARVLGALLSGSQALSELLTVHPEWLGTILDTELIQTIPKRGYCFTGPVSETEESVIDEGRKRSRWMFLIVAVAIVACSESRSGSSAGRLSPATRFRPMGA